MKGSINLMKITDPKTGLSALVSRELGEKYLAAVKSKKARPELPWGGVK